MWNHNLMFDPFVQGFVEASETLGFLGVGIGCVSCLGSVVVVDESSARVADGGLVRAIQQHIKSFLHCRITVKIILIVRFIERLRV